ncbi:MAG: lipid II:glycine glycyltransferase FemX [Rhodopila sp.]
MSQQVETAPVLTSCSIPEIERLEESQPILISTADARIDPAWDDAVATVLGGDLVQTTRWAATRQQIGMRVHHLRLFTPDGTILAGCLIQCRRILPGIWVGAVPRGPLLFTEEPNLADRLVSELMRTARAAGLVLLIVRPAEGQEAQLRPALHAAGFRPGGPPISPGATIRIDLHRSEEEILRSAHPRRRTHIRNALRSGLECRISDDVETFHRLHMASARRSGFPPVWIGNLKAQWAILAPAGLCQLIEVRHDGAPIAAEWLTCFGGIVSSKMKGQDLSNIPATPASKVTGTAAVWASICWARLVGAQYFDFSGFDRAAAEAIAKGQKLPHNLPPHDQIKWSFGGEVVLLPQSYFASPNGLAQYLLGGFVLPILNSHAIRRLMGRLRATPAGVFGRGAHHEPGAKPKSKRTAL